MKIFFSAGEPSGDVHGANVIRKLRQLRPDIQCVGYGGPEMAAAGCQLHVDLTALAVMWFLRVLLNLHKFLHLASRADRYFRHQRPDAVVLIDYPGFNWWIAWRAKAHGIPVLYYCPPQIWSWGSWRIKKIRRYVDHVLCTLPFEEKWFREQGCRATFVGHPFFDEVRRQQLDEQFLETMRQKSGRLITILPGSRTQEVQHNLKWFLKAAALVQVRFPKVRFAVAAFKPQQAQIAQQLIAQTKLPVEVYVRKTPELMQLAECCMACSGSVSLELLYHKKPTVILYWISPLAYRVQQCFRRVKYITLVNLLTAKELFPADTTPYSPSDPDAHRVLFPEYLTSEDKSLQIASHLIQWLASDDQRDGLIAQLAELKAKVGHGGASQTAAEMILAEADRHARLVPPKPHFVPGMIVASSDGGEKALLAAKQSNGDSPQRLDKAA
ncbi:MAG TPA: lipid-A-disaccharide synthase [Pirellulales bacterium]|jgi:lipid-A-disaccharide synthase|nr:lipid-A-disaccharide synthase [Pirellulales bacterium]